MKVCLIHPPHPNSTDDRLDPPMGLLYIAAYLQQNNIDVEIVDISGMEKEYWGDIPFADFYGITAYISSLYIAEAIATRCKYINPLSKVIVGGAHPSSCPNDFYYADHVVVGQGEVAMLDIVTGKEFKKIVIGTEPQDSFMFPAYHLIDIDSYHRTIDDKPSLPYLTSRGCPFNCVYCGLAKMHRLGKKVRMASPSVVYNHIKRMKDEFGIDKVNFQDDIFTIDSQRLFTMLDLIASLNIKFRCMGRAGYDTEATYQRLAEAGCVQVAWGIESGSQSMLNRIGKKCTVKDNGDVIRWAKKYGIVSRAFFMIGFPGETQQTIEETKAFIDKSDPDQYFVSNFIPYPGTPVGDNPEEFGITHVYKEYDQFYQVSMDGTGGAVIDTKWLLREEFKELELEFRNWINKRSMRGSLQKYESKRRE